MDRLAQAARALVTYMDARAVDFATGCLVDALRSALPPATGGGEAFVNVNNGGRDDPACTCDDLPALPCIKHAVFHPTPAPGGGEVGPVAWQMVDKTYGPTAYLGVTEEAAWDRMEAATGFPRAKWEADRHVRPLYAHPTPAPLGGAEAGCVRVERGGLGGPDALWLHIGHQGFRIVAEPDAEFPGRVDWFEKQLRAAVATIEAHQPAPAGEAFTTQELDDAEYWLCRTCRVPTHPFILRLIKHARAHRAARNA